MENLFKGLFDSEAASSVTIANFFICLFSALVMGFIIAKMYTFKNQYSKSFVTTLALLPAVVCVVIMMVNGNVGAGIAVAGAFSLVRFRSVPGTAKEMGNIFLAMGAGMIIGMGYVAYAFMFVFVLGIANMVYSGIGFGESKVNSVKSLRIVIPESLDYTDVFKEVMEEYTTEYKLRQVKTTNMGSLFKLSFDLVMKDGANEKAFIDALRCRNGNLEIMICEQEQQTIEL